MICESSCTKTFPQNIYVKEIAFKTSMRFLYNLTKNSRSNPIEYFFGYLKPLLEDMPYKRFDDYA